MAWHKQKYSKIIILFVTVLILTPLVYSLFSPVKSKHYKIETKPQKNKPIYEGMSAQGLSLSEQKMGQLVYSAQIGSFKIKRKKLGFFKIGLVKVAHLEDVVLNLNLDNLDSLSTSANPPVSSPVSSNISGASNFSAQIANEATADVTGNGASDNFIKNVLLNSEQVKSLDLDKVKELEISNLTVNLLDNKGTISVISCRQARIPILKRKLVLEGNVEVASRERGTLACNELYLEGKGESFKVDGFYTLSVDKRVYRGKGLETNYLLDGIDLRKLHLIKRG